MTLSIRTDANYAEGGYALLEGPDLDDVTAISVENCASGQFLGEDGRWKKTPFAFPVEATPAGDLSLGPHLVDLVPTELLVVVHAQDGRSLGRLFWTDILPSRNPFSVTSEPMLERHRPEAEDKTAEDAEQSRDAAPQTETAQWEDVEAVADQAAEEIAGQAVEDATFQEEVRVLARQAAAEIAEHTVEGTEQEHADATARETAPAPARTSGEGSTLRRDAPGLSLHYWVVAALLVLVVGGFAAAVGPSLRGPSEPQPPRQDARSTERPATPPAPTPAPQEPSPSEGRRLVPRGNQKASFPCQSSMSEPIAQLICGDRDLAAADWRLGIALKAAMKTRGTAARRALMAEERAWLPQRNDICGIPTDGEREAEDLAQFKECLLREIERRADEIERRL